MQWQGKSGGVVCGVPIALPSDGTMVSHKASPAFSRHNRYAVDVVRQHVMMEREVSEECVLYSACVYSCYRPGHVVCPGPSKEFPRGRSSRRSSAEPEAISVVGRDFRRSAGSELRPPIAMDTAR